MEDMSRPVRQLKSDVDEIYGMLEHISATQAEHGTLLRGHGTELADVRGLLTGLDAKVDGLDAKFTGLFTGLDAKVDGLDAKFTGLFTGLDAKLDRVLDQLGPANAADSG